MPTKRIQLVVFLVLSFVVYIKVYAQEDAFEKFLTDSNVSYKVNVDGTTEVSHDITITNQKSDLIVSSYSIELKENVFDIDASSKNREVEVATTTENNITKLTTRFDDFIIGEGKKNNLYIKYKSQKIASKIGNIWNINIPKIGSNNEHNSYNISLIIPPDLGEQLYISPKPDKQEIVDKNTIYYFGKDKITKSGITASFGTYQQINFRLVYQLQNSNYFKSEYDIALPPEIVGTQQVKYTSVKPEPKKVTLDSQGNTIATYDIKSKDTLEVELVGSARITGRQIDPVNGGFFKDIPANLKTYTTESRYWETNSESIKNLARTLKDGNSTVAQNANKIYDYILENYKYDFTINTKEGLDRKGAETALLDKSGWGCMEFTDLFIATARAMGIPARQLNGFALSKDDENMPLSVVLNGGDRLHAWPEFYDPNLGWIAIDPTWGSTSGVDYFTKLDTNHFVFVIRGKDSEYPLSAGEYRNDSNKKLVEVEFQSDNTNMDFTPAIDVKKTLTINPIAWFKKQSNYKITNTGQVFVYLENGKSIPPYGKGSVYIQNDANTLTILDFVKEDTKVAL